MENILSALSKKSELIPDEHDGSYELVRETVRALSTLNYDDIKVEDLNMLYFSTVGTFSRTFNHKEACINKSSLNDIEKQKLRETLKKIRAKAVNGDYNNHGKSDVIGMFGTGIGTLRVSEANSKKVIKLCIDIIDVEDDDIVINIVDIALKDYMKGLGIASISQILHCLKPFVFPIFNKGPDSSGLEVYRNLGFKLIKPTDTIYYIENTKRIKKFRDENFKFKNYRVFDTFFWTYKPPPPPVVDENDDEINPIFPEIKLYSKEKFLEEIFIESEKYDEMIYSLNIKKNIILQGPPGTGKTFIAKRLAYSILGGKDNDKVEMVQFHQSYSYEDFVQGFRPTENGMFELNDGIFYRFCEKAKANPDSKYFFIIDEINRGNLSKIFGELLMLLEEDKRGKEYEIPLIYSKEERFFIPSNIFIIGTMNTADRSLAMVDYALRRRFRFINIEPAFNSEKFRKHLEGNNIEIDIIDKIILKFNRLNSKIKDDIKDLGKGYEIGHSYFCGKLLADESAEDWYRRIIDLEIKPLLYEYWFDNEETAKIETENLL